MFRKTSVVLNVLRNFWPGMLSSFEKSDRAVESTHFWTIMEYSHRVQILVFAEIILWELTPESEYEASKHRDFMPRPCLKISQPQSASQNYNWSRLTFLNEDLHLKEGLLFSWKFYNNFRLPGMWYFKNPSRVPGIWTWALSKLYHLLALVQYSSSMTQTRYDSWFRFRFVFYEI